MTTEMLDILELKNRITALERQVAHPGKSTHCERIAKMFLLRELEAELQRARQLEPADPQLSGTDF